MSQCLLQLIAYTTMANSNANNNVQVTIAEPGLMKPDLPKVRNALDEVEHLPNVSIKQLSPFMDVLYQAIEDFVKVTTSDSVLVKVKDNLHIFKACVKALRLCTDELVKNPAYCTEIIVTIAINVSKTVVNTVTVIGCAKTVQESVGVIAKKTTVKTAKKSLRFIAKKTTEETAEESLRFIAKKTTEETAEESLRFIAKKTTEETAEESLRIIAKKTTEETVEGSVRVAVVETAKRSTVETAKKSAKRAFISSAVIDVSLLVFSTGYSYYLYKKKEKNENENSKIAWEEHKKYIAKRTVAAGGSVAGTTTGAFVGTLICPGVGSFVGGVIGGMVGDFFGSKAGETAYDKFSTPDDKKDKKDEKDEKDKKNEKDEKDEKDVNDEKDKKNE